MKKPTQILITAITVCATAGWAFFATAETETNTTRIRLDEPTIVKGYTVKNPDSSFIVGIRPYVFSEPSSIKLTNIVEDFAEPEGKTRASETFLYNIEMQNPQVLENPIIVSLEYNSEIKGKKSIYFYDRTSEIWKAIPTNFDTKNARARAFIHFPFSYLAVFADPSAETEGPNKTGDAPLGIGATAGVVIDAESGDVLFEKNADTALQMASLTKLMTAYTAYKLDVAPSNIYTVTAADYSYGSQVGVRAGERYSVNDLFYGALVKSGNDTAKALAHATGHSIPAFVKKMNENAASLGLSQTHFEGVTGLELGNKTSAKDFAKLSREILKEPKMLQYTTTRNYCMISRCFHNTNNLLWSDLYITGGKTGYLPRSSGGSGSSLMSKIKGENGKEIIVVALGNATKSGRFGDVSAMAKWTFNNYSWQ